MMAPTCLWDEACCRASHTPAHPSPSASNALRARFSVQNGRFRKAIQALVSNGLAPLMTIPFQLCYPNTLSLPHPHPLLSHLPPPLPLPSCLSSPLLLHFSFLSPPFITIFYSLLICFSPSYPSLLSSLLPFSLPHSRVVSKAVLLFHPDSAPGPIGLRANHIKEGIRCPSPSSATISSTSPSSPLF